MKKTTLIVLSVGLFLISCNDDNKTEEIMQENLDAMSSEKESEITTSDDNPVLEYDEVLSPPELKDLWEMANAETFHEKNICFNGFVYSNESADSISSGMIAFKPFSSDSKVIPMVHCEFAGNFGTTFEKYEVGGKIKIVGKLISINDREKHNFIFTNCSIQ